MNKQGLQISLTPELSEEIFFNALCNSLTYLRTSYGLSIGYHTDDYESAKSKLKDTSVCYEDVLLQILKDGNIITIEEDCSEVGDSVILVITLEDIHKKVQHSPSEYLLQMINEEDDAVTGDVILQTVFFGKVVYG